MYKISNIINNITGDIMHIKDIMTRNIICAKKNSTIYEVSNLMKMYNIGFIPVKNNNEIIGVITDRDIVIKALTNKCNINSNIESYISRNIIYIDINKSIDEALNLMGENQIKRLIVKNGNESIGVLSLSDIINNYNNNIISVLKRIWKIQNNNQDKNSEIDSFYL